MENITSALEKVLFNILMQNENIDHVEDVIQNKSTKKKLQAELCKPICMITSLFYHYHNSSLQVVGLFLFKK